MQFSIPPELEELRGRLRSFLEELRPLEARVGEDGSVPRDVAGCPILNSRSLRV